MLTRTSTAANGHTGHEARRWLENGLRIAAERIWQALSAEPAGSIDPLDRPADQTRSAERVRGHADGLPLCCFGPGGNHRSAFGVPRSTAEAIAELDLRLSLIDVSLGRSGDRRGWRGRSLNRLWQKASGTAGDLGFDGDIGARGGARDLLPRAHEARRPQGDSSAPVGEPHRGGTAGRKRRTADESLPPQRFEDTLGRKSQ